MKIDPIKTAKITAALSVVVTAMTAAGTMFRWVRGSGAEPALLKEPGVVAHLKARRPQGAKPEQKESALVAQARLFALGINPPPPPPPPRPERTKPVATAPRPTAPEAPKPVAPTFTAKSKLVATAVYPDYPEKSLALLDMGNVLGLRWVRVGDAIEHQVVREIHPDHVVLAQGNQAEVVPIQSEPPKRYKSLLAQADTAANAAGSATEGLAPAVTRRPGGLPQPTATTNRRGPVPPTGTPAGSPTLGSRSRSIPTRPGSTLTGSGSSGRTFRTLPAAPTPEERRRMAEQNITDIQKLIKESDNLPGVSEEEKARERELWNKLLQIMEQEKNRATEPPQASSEDDAKAEPIKTR